MGSQMRYMEKFMAASLTHAPYTWDAVYNLILERETYEAGVVSVPKTVVSIAEHISAYTATIKEFILPRVFAQITVLDGVGWGNIRLFAGATFSGTGFNITVPVYIHAHISVLARTYLGVDRILATHDTEELIATFVGMDQSFETYEDFPLRISFNNQKILASERLVLSITYHARWYYANSVNESSFLAGQYHTINSNNLFLEVPIVGG